MGGAAPILSRTRSPPFLGPGAAGGRVSHEPADSPFGHPPPQWRDPVVAAAFVVVATGGAARGLVDQPGLEHALQVAVQGGGEDGDPPARAVRDLLEQCVAVAFAPA